MSPFGIEPEITCHSVFIEKVLRRLKHCHFVIAEKADGALEEIATGHKIRIETNDQIALSKRKSVIQIAGFRVRIVGPVKILAAQFLG